MKKEFTYQDLEHFFDQLRMVPECVSLEKVAAILQNPVYSENFHSKGRGFRNWTYIITGAVLVISTIFLLQSAFHGNESDITQAVSNNHIPSAQKSNISGPDSISSDTARQIEREIKNTVIADGDSELTIPAEDKTSADKEEATGISGLNTELKSEPDTDIPMQGNPYIIDDLSLEELGNLGFDIQHYAVFYRNTRSDAKCLFFTIKNKPFIKYGYSENELNREGNIIKIDNTLMRDTFPDEIRFYNRITTEKSIPGQFKEPDYYHFQLVERDYFPVYVSTLDQNISGILPAELFHSANDTLLPVIVPFSRLNCDQKEDLVFWFRTSETFFQNIPGRYSQLRSYIEANKMAKRMHANINLVEYDFMAWATERAFPRNEKIDGKKFIMELTREEQEKIGLLRSKENDQSMAYYFLTPWGSGKGAGAGRRVWIKMPNSEGRDSVPFFIPDTLIRADYLPEYITDDKGNSIRMNTTGRVIQSMLISNDIIVPVKESGRIYWFSQSESFWSLIPGRYQHLKEVYEKIMFTKSLYPDIDLVDYFLKERKHVDMNVQILDLSKKELENIGFTMIRDSMVMQSSVYNNEWIQFSLSFPIYYKNMPEATVERMINKNGLRSYTQYVNEDNRDFQLENNGLDYEELIKSPFQGFAYVMITDESGHELAIFRSKAREEFLSGKESQYLIPVRVPLQDLFSKYSETKIFWFTPTEAFFNRLPDRIREDLKSDYYSLTDDLTTSSCTYFEACKSTLELNQFQLYPNPAQDQVTVSFNSSEMVTANMYLVDIKGTIVKSLEANAEILAGNNTFNYALDGVSPGIYLFAVQSEAGIKTVRLIISE